MKVQYPERTFATVDHILPTTDTVRPFEDSLAEEMVAALEKNTNEYGIKYFDPGSDHNGIIHVIAPELGLTQPGMTVVCGDSHTSTHGAFGAIAFGIGTSQVRDVLASQTLALNKPKVRRIKIDGVLQEGVSAKDISLKIGNVLGVKGGAGYAYEYAGSTIENLSMEERMTVCNMTIEWGARFGYVNPDSTTFDYLKGRKYAPPGGKFEEAAAFWESIRSDEDAVYDDETVIDVGEIEPMVTWGINPGQSVGISGSIPSVDELPSGEREITEQAYSYMGFAGGQSVDGSKIDAAFIGSCTNSRYSDLENAAKIVHGNKIAPGVRAIVVPGSKSIFDKAVEQGLNQTFINAGFEWRKPGCSMCLAMNPDKLIGRELCASSSNRNFIGRQGSPEGRTMLMSPAMVAAAAIKGEITDVRRL